MSKTYINNNIACSRTADGHLFPETLMSKDHYLHAPLFTIREYLMSTKFYFKETTKYHKWYNNLIKKAEERQMIEGYKEKHHIKPKCMKGENILRNRIDLTGREHFVAHQILVKMFPKNKGLIYALYCMCHWKNDSMIRNNRKYEWVRKKFCMMLSKNRKGSKHPFYGRKHTKETKERISNALKNRVLSEETLKRMSESHIGEKHNFYGKRHSKETIRKMSLVKKGKKLSKETKEKISKAHKGKKVSEETKKKIAQKLKGNKNAKKVEK